VEAGGELRAAPDLVDLVEVQLPDMDNFLHKAPFT
jgi:hypothetical protein